jgi:hypothetical protein
MCIYIIMRRCCIRNDQLDEATESIVGDMYTVILLFDMIYLGRDHQYQDEVYIK